MQGASYDRRGSLGGSVVFTEWSTASDLSLLRTRNASAHGSTEPIFTDDELRRFIRRQARRFSSGVINWSHVDRRGERRRDDFCIGGWPRTGSTPERTTKSCDAGPFEPNFQGLGVAGPCSQYPAKRGQCRPQCTRSPRAIPCSRSARAIPALLYSNPTHARLFRSECVNALTPALNPGVKGAEPPY